MLLYFIWHYICDTDDLNFGLDCPLGTCEAYLEDILVKKKVLVADIAQGRSNWCLNIEVSWKYSFYFFIDFQFAADQCYMSVCIKSIKLLSFLLVVHTNWAQMGRILNGKCTVSQLLHHIYRIVEVRTICRNIFLSSHSNPLKTKWKIHLPKCYSSIDVGRWFFVDIPHYNRLQL